MQSSKKVILYGVIVVILAAGAYFISTKVMDKQTASLRDVQIKSANAGGSEPGSSYVFNAYGNTSRWLESSGSTTGWGDYTFLVSVSNHTPANLTVQNMCSNAVNTTSGFAFEIQNSNGQVQNTGTVKCDVTYQLGTGLAALSTKYYAITISYKPTVSGMYKAVLKNVKFYTPGPGASTIGSPVNGSPTPYTLDATGSKVSEPVTI